MTTLTVGSERFGRVDLDVADTGQGRTFLLLHGGAGPSSMAPLAARLARQPMTRVVAPTHPGFDGTARPASVASVADLAQLYAELLDALDVTDVTVVGNSLGGWIALELALLASPRVARMVLCDAVGIEVPGHPVADFFALDLADAQSLSFHDPKPFRVDEAALPEGAREVLAGNRASLEVLAGRSFGDATLQDRAGTIDVPTLVVWGDSDGIADVDYGRRLAAALRKSEFVVLPDTGHLPALESPALLFDEVWRFAGVWRREFSLDTDLSSADLWQALEALETGRVPMASGDGRELVDRFGVGGTILSSPAGVGVTLTSTIVAFERERLLTIETPFNGLTLRLRHTLRPHDGGTRIFRELAISGPDAQDQGPVAGPRISADYADALAEIVAVARSLAR